MDKKIAYLHCSSGISGDMFLSAFIDAGISPRTLERQLKRGLKFRDFKVKVSWKRGQHVAARHVDVVGEKHFSSPFAIRRFIARSTLSKKVKARSITILERLIDAESRVHGAPRNGVHFHELGSIDTLIDITGACLAMELAGIDVLIASPVNVGAPAPATVSMLTTHSIPIYSTTSRFEMATPTGIAILSTLASSFGDMPLVHIMRSGRGAGTREIPGSDNVLTLIIGKRAQDIQGPYKEDTVIVLSTNIDDMDPRIFPYVIERLLSAGAKDAWLTQIIMKKGRPGILLSAITDADHEALIVDIIFKETTTLGIRRQMTPRYVLERHIRGEKKFGVLPGGTIKTKLEFEKARSKALSRNIPLKDILY